MTISGKEVKALAVGDYCSWATTTSEVVLFKLPENYKTEYYAIWDDGNSNYSTGNWHDMIPSNEPFTALCHPLDWYIDSFHSQFPYIKVSGGVRSIKKVLKMVVI